MNSSEWLAVKWLDQAVEWLNPDQKDSESLSDPVRLLLNKLRDKAQKNELKACFDLIENLKALADKSEISESAEIRLRCGLVLARLNFFKEALVITHEAVSKYKQGHNNGVALWMEGCIEWVLPGKEIDAISSWRDSMKSFEKLKFDKRGENSKYKWYEEQLKMMERALHIATDKYGIPPLPPYSDDSSEASENKNNDNSSKESYPGNQVIDWMEISHVYEHIKAGNFGPSGVLSQPVAELEINQVFINGCPYLIQSLNGNRFVRVIPPLNFTVIKVSGDSMDKAGILEDDYILLRLLPKNLDDNSLLELSTDDPSYYSEVDHPQRFLDGKIVAAEISNEDDEIVLKRCYIRGNKVILSPESTNPKHQEREFDGTNKDFAIPGIAIAVLKKVP